MQAQGVGTIPYPLFRRRIRMDIDMESYYQGQLDIVEYLYELLEQKNYNAITAYLTAVHNSKEMGCRYGKA